MVNNDARIHPGSHRARHGKHHRGSWWCARAFGFLFRSTNSHSGMSAIKHHNFSICVEMENEGHEAEEITPPGREGTFVMIVPRQTQKIKQIVIRNTGVSDFDVLIRRDMTSCPFVVSLPASVGGTVQTSVGCTVQTSVGCSAPTSNSDTKRANSVDCVVNAPVKSVNTTNEKEKESKACSWGELSLKPIIETLKHGLQMFENKTAWDFYMESSNTNIRVLDLTINPKTSTLFPKDTPITGAFKFPPGIDFPCNGCLVCPKTLGGSARHVVAQNSTFSMNLPAKTRGLYFTVQDAAEDPVRLQLKVQLMEFDSKNAKFLFRNLYVEHWVEKASHIGLLAPDGWVMTSAHLLTTDYNMLLSNWALAIDR